MFLAVFATRVISIHVRYLMRLLVAGVVLLASYPTNGFMSKAPPVATPLLRSTHRCNTMKLDSSLMSRLRVGGTVLLGGTLMATGLVANAGIARSDLSISPTCVTGEGANCEDLAEGNEFIKSLQAKSALSKDKYFKETLEKYNDHNFKDYFRAENKHMVRHKDGRYEIITNSDYAQAEKAGKVKNDIFLNE